MRINSTGLGQGDGGMPKAHRRAPQMYGMPAGAGVEPVLAASGEPLWFLGTLVRLTLTGEQTGGRFAMWEQTFPRGASPPVHTHPQDETFVVLDGDVTVWIGERDPASETGSGETTSQTGMRSRRCGPGAALFAPGGAPHSFRVDSDTARMLFLSTPAGIERYITSLAEPARWPWLQPPHDGPRVSRAALEAAEQAHGVVRVGAPRTDPTLNHKEQP
jgi:quercetin dioxygenase-like cupin family protein